MAQQEVGVGVVPDAEHVGPGGTFLGEAAEAAVGLARRPGEGQRGIDLQAQRLAFQHEAILALLQAEGGTGEAGKVEPLSPLPGDIRPAPGKFRCDRPGARLAEGAVLAQHHAPQRVLENEHGQDVAVVDAQFDPGVETGGKAEGLQRFHGEPGRLSKWRRTFARRAGVSSPTAGVAGSGSAPAHR
jgi:hypothetical protein